MARRKSVKSARPAQKTADRVVVAPKRRGSFLPFVGATAGLAWSLFRSGSKSTVGQRGLGPSSGGDARDRPGSKASKNTATQTKADRGPAGKAYGRGASTPEEIPPKGWLQIVKRTFAKFSENELMQEAAGITFYALLSLFPALAAIVSIYGLFSDPHTIAKNLDALSSVLPSGGMDIVRQQVDRLVQSPASGLSVGAIIGVLTALWSANQGTKAMFSALNDVYGEHEERGFLKLTAMSLAFTAGAIVLLLVGVALLVVVPLLFKAIGMSGVYDAVVAVVRWPLILVLIMLALAVLFRYGPSRRRAKWRWLTWGSAFGAIGWVGLSIGFSWYVANFGSYNKTYGSLGAIIGFMTWIWLSSTVLLLGAQINAEMEAQTATDSTAGGPRPLGSRGAKAADVVSGG